MIWISPLIIHSNVIQSSSYLFFPPALCLMGMFSKQHHCSPLVPDPKPQNHLSFKHHIQSYSYKKALSYSDTHLCFYHIQASLMRQHLHRLTPLNSTSVSAPLTLSPPLRYLLSAYEKLRCEWISRKLSCWRRLRVNVLRLKQEKLHPVSMELVMKPCAN